MTNTFLFISKLESQPLTTVNTHSSGYYKSYSPLSHSLGER